MSYAAALAFASAALGWSTSAVLAVAQSGARRRMALVARACHELRGPLSAARLALDGLHTTREAARVTAIDVELQRAALALDDLAAARRGRRAPDWIELVDVGALVRACAESWRSVAAAHGAGFAIAGAGPDAIVRGDRLRIAQACANLVANAAEHGGGLVRVHVVRRAESVRIEVADDGAGLPAPLSALSAAMDGRPPGRGHGLAIAGAIATRHGGRLATAPAGAGARMVIELPAATGAGTRRTARPRRTTRPRRRTRRRPGSRVPAA